MLARFGRHPILVRTGNVEAVVARMGRANLPRFDLRTFFQSGSDSMCNSALLTARGVLEARPNSHSGRKMVVPV
jgi:hypothetical protein